VAGTDNSGKPVYWKNGVPTSLSANTGGGHSIQVIDGVVYIAGQETVGADVRAVFWQDGVATYLSDAGTDGLASSIYVSGSDVYVMGLYQDYTKLAYWKNGVSGKVDMDTGSYSPTKPSADIFWRLPRIFVNGSDVYVVDPLGDGTDITAGGYWKNGVLSTPTEEIYTNVFVK